jgi:hypothetical protein
MAPPRKKRLAPREGHSVHLRLPSDVFTRVEAKAKAEGRPFNRIIINDLAAIPYLEQQAKLGELIGDMEVTLAKYGARITLADLAEALLLAIDEALAAKTDNQLQARLDKVRVLRAEMAKFERQAER